MLNGGEPGNVERDRVGETAVQVRILDRFAQAAVDDVAEPVVAVVDGVDGEGRRATDADQAGVGELGAVGAAVGGDGDQRLGLDDAEHPGVAEVDDLRADGEIGRGVGIRAEVDPALAEEVGLVEVDGQRIGGVAGVTVDGIGHEEVAAADRRGDENGEVLRQVGAGVGVVEVVRRAAVVAEIDAEPAIAENRVPPDHAADATGDGDAVGRVARQDVAGAGGNAADGGGRTQVDPKAVGQSGQAVGPGADPVALNQHRGRGGDLDAEVLVPGDEIPGPRSSAADEGTGRAEDVDPDAVRNRTGPRPVAADTVALDELSRSVQVQTVAGVGSREEISLPGAGPPDDRRWAAS